MDRKPTKRDYKEEIKGVEKWERAKKKIRERG
jgi:hypothetical protein